jgi:glutathione peroxidase
MTAEIPWNFGKFLVDGNGRVVRFYGPKVQPKKMVADVERVLEGHELLKAKL